jgi:hypothetical protein
MAGMRINPFKILFCLRQVAEYGAEREMVGSSEAPLRRSYVGISNYGLENNKYRCSPTQLTFLA